MTVPSPVRAQHAPSDNVACGGTSGMRHERRSGFPDVGRSAARRPIRVTSCARPTGTLAGLLAVGAVCCLLGLLLDERTLMAAAVMTVAMSITDLLAFLGQWMVARGAGTTTSALKRLLTPAYTERTALYERVDQHGEHVSWHEGDIPRRRGLYMPRGTRVRWRSPLGLFTARHIIPGEGEERRMLPGLTSSVTPRERGTSKTMPGFGGEREGGVRDYVPGDPLRGISWKHTAARGRLMSWETTREREPTLLLALNTCGECGLDEAGMDAEVAALMPYLRQEPRYGLRRGLHGGLGRRVFVTDGHTIHEGYDALRFLAAVCAVSGDSCIVSPNKCAVSAITCAQALSRTASTLPNPVTVVVADASVSKGLRQALLRTPLAHKARILNPTAQETPQSAHLFPETTQETPQSAHSFPETAQKAHSPGHTLPRLIRATALTGCFALTLRALVGLVSPDGIWFPFAVALLALAVLDDAFPPLPRNGKRAFRAFRGIWGRLRYPLLVLASVIPAMLLRFRGLYGAWPISPRVCRVGGVSGRCVEALFDEVFAQSASGPSASGLSASGPVKRSLLGALREGFDALYLQLPPLTVEGSADLFLVLVVAVVALAVRAVVGVRALSSFAVVFPVAALCVNALLLGETPSWSMVCLTVCLWPALLWSVTASRPIRIARVAHPFAQRRETPRTRSSRPARPEISRSLRTPDFPLAVLAAVLAVALTVACAPAAERWAYRTPLTLDMPGLSGISGVLGGNGGATTSGLFSSNTVEPLVDLRRSLSADALAERSSRTALTYRSDRPLYLRLTSLDRFDGDVWGYDRDFAVDAGLYGSGLRLGLDRSNTLRDRERRYVSPLREASSWDSSGVWPEELSSVLYELSADVEVRVGSLRSRFLPVPSDVGSVSGLGGDWLSYRDGTVYRRAAVAEEGTSYMASGVAFDPVRGVSGFAMVDAAHGALEDALEDALAGTSGADAADAESGDLAGGGAARRAAAADDLRRTVDSSDRQAHDERYLWLPDRLPEHVRAVVEEARADGVSLGGGDYASQSQAMRWLVSWFTSASNGFVYDLSAPDGEGRSNLQVVDDFLARDGRRGYCQHYASALAVLGRAMGVPTRIVLGYAPGRSRGASADAEGRYVVSEGDLHAWTEAYLDGVGWVPFDVTPSSDASSEPTSDGGGDAASTADGVDGVDDAGGVDGAGVPEFRIESMPRPSDDVDAGAGVSDAGVSRDGFVSVIRNGLGVFVDRFRAMPLWWRMAWVVAALAAVASMAAFVRRGRRAGAGLRGGYVRGRPMRWLRRRARGRVLATARRAAGSPDDGDSSARAWREAWRLVCREGRRAGVRWDASATDGMIAEALWRAMGSESDGGAGSAVPPEGSTSGVPAGEAVADAFGAGASSSDDTPAGGFDVSSDNASRGVRDAGGRVPTLRDDLLRLARNADAAAFSGRPESAETLVEVLGRVFRVSPR